MLDVFAVEKLIRSGDTAGAHAVLDAAVSSDDVNAKHYVAFWRANILIDEKRFEDALSHLEKYESDFGCKTIAYHTKASIFNHLGNDHAAIDILSNAPLNVELITHFEIVIDAIFHLLWLMANNHMKIDEELFLLIPEDYATFLPTRERMFGQNVTKNMLSEIVKLNCL